jgi:hypothetical protein
MHKCLEAVDNLFETSGWIMTKTNKLDLPRSYYQKCYELDRFEIKSYNDRNMTYKTVIPMSDTSYSLSIDEDSLYDYIYNHMQASIQKNTCQN